MRARACPGTWETPSFPRKEAGGATGEQRPWLTAADAGHRESERRASTAVPPSEGNEARREGRWGVGAP